MKALLLTLLFTGFGYAHSMYQSSVMLDFTGSHEIHAEIQLPQERLQASMDQAYVLSHFSAYSKEGSFAVRLAAPLTTERVDGAPYVVAHLVLSPPSLRVPDTFDIEDDVLPSQATLVSLRSDWQNSVFANDPQLIGVIRGSFRSITIDRTGGSWFNGFRSILKLGVRHIAEGTDHLLFLLALLLPAPLLVSHSRWSGAATARQSLLRILKVVSAFTVGHSITLALAALDIIHVPSRPIEALIALSILVSAIHAMRPIFPGREAAIAAAFGLIHGLAFATTLGELGLGRWDRVASIFAFNLGIEAMQLVVVAATMPSLLLLSRTRAYPIVRMSGAIFAAVASSGWIAERFFSQQTPVDLVVNGIAHQAIWIASLLLLTSLVLWGFESRSRHSAIGASPLC